MGFDAALLSLSGLSVGDAFGQSLTFQGAQELIARRELPLSPWNWTEDTQLALSVVEELRLRDWIDQDYLARRMAWRYRIDPSRGYGNSTRQVLSRVAQGEYFRTVAKSVNDGGSYGSSGSARAIPLGAFYTESPARAAREAPLTAAITHMHPESFAGAQAVAIAAAMAAQTEFPVGQDFLQSIVGYVAESEVRQRIAQISHIPADDWEQCLKYLAGDNFSTVQTAVPFALWCAAHHLDSFEDALWLTVSGLGCRDTTCAIVGGIVALSCRNVPANWTNSIEPLPASKILSDKDFATLQPPDRQTSKAVSLVPAQKDDAQETYISIREDPLTGCANLLGLMDYVDQLAPKPDGFPISLFLVHVVHLFDLNLSDGRTAGDNLLRAYAERLGSLGMGKVFRVGGNKFAVLMQGTQQSLEHAKQLACTMIEWPESTLPHTALIHFPHKEEAIKGRLLACLHEAISGRHHGERRGDLREFQAPELRSLPDFSWMVVDLADQIQKMAKIVDEADLLANTDIVSQLPNQRAAMSALERNFRQAREYETALAILMFDGDNLREYNKISYEVGDEAILRIGSTLKSQLRSGDFLARWRTGDEFLIILPNTSEEEAIQMGKRMCTAIAQASRGWRIATSISAGVAVYPKHGPTLHALLEAAEHGLEAAKAHGKNRVEVGSAHKLSPGE